MAAAENVARAGCSASEVHTAWMNSAVHKANILNPNYNAIGIASAPAPQGLCYWTAIFFQITRPAQPPPALPPQRDASIPPIAPGSNTIASGVWTGLASRPQGDGFWCVGRDGGVVAFGSARFSGSMQGQVRKHKHERFYGTTSHASAAIT